MKKYKTIGECVNDMSRGTPLKIVLDKSGFFRYNKPESYYHIIPSKWTGMAEWCKETFGTEHYAFVEDGIWVETEADLTLLILKWSGK